MTVHKRKRTFLFTYGLQIWSTTRGKVILELLLKPSDVTFVSYVSSPGLASFTSHHKILPSDLLYRRGQKFLDKFFGWRNFGEMFVFRAQNLSGATSEPPTKYSQNILVMVICVPRQCFPIDAQLTITKKQVYAVESTMSRSGNSAALPAIRVGMAL